MVVGYIPKHSSQNPVYGLFVLAMVLLFIAHPVQSHGTREAGVALDVNLFNELNKMSEPVEPDIRIRLPETSPVEKPWFKADLFDRTFEQPGLYRSEFKVCGKDIADGRSTKCYTICKTTENIWEPNTTGSYFCPPGKFSANAPFAHHVLLVGAAWNNAAAPKEIFFGKDVSHAGDARLLSLEDLTPYPGYGGKNESMSDTLRWRRTGGWHEWYGSTTARTDGAYTLVLRKPEAMEQNKRTLTRHEFLIGIDATALREAVGNRTKKGRNRSDPSPSFRQGLPGSRAMDGKNTQGSERLQKGLLQTYKKLVIENNIRIFLNGRPVPMDDWNNYLPEYGIIEDGLTRNHKETFRVRLTWANIPNAELRAFGVPIQCIHDNSCLIPSSAAKTLADIPDAIAGVFDLAERILTARTRDPYKLTTVAQVRLLPLSIQPLMGTGKVLSDWIDQDEMLEYSQESGQSPGTFHSLYVPLVPLGGDIVGAIAIDSGLAGSETRKIRIASDQKSDLLIVVYQPAPFDTSGTEHTIKVDGNSTSIALQAKKPVAVKPEPVPETVSESHWESSESSMPRTETVTLMPSQQDLKILQNLRILWVPSPSQPDVDRDTFHRLIGEFSYSQAIETDGDTKTVILTLHEPAWARANKNLRKQIDSNDAEVPFELRIPEEELPRKVQLETPPVSPVNADSVSRPENRPQKFTVRIWPGRQIGGSFQAFRFAEGKGCDFALHGLGGTQKIHLRYAKIKKGLPILIGTLISNAPPKKGTLRKAVLSISGDLDKSGLPCVRGRLPLHPIDVTQEGVDVRVLFPLAAR